MKTKYIWVAAVISACYGNGLASASEAPITTFASDHRALSFTEPWTGLFDSAGFPGDVLPEPASTDIAIVEVDAERTAAMLASSPGPLPWLGDGSFIAAIQPHSVEIGVPPQQRLFDFAGELSPSVPEPETWAMLLAGLGLIGLQLRHGLGGKIDAH